MNKIIPLRPSLVGRPVQRGEAWYLFLDTKGGKKPKGHPPLERGPRGKVLLAVNQVWVELHTGMLWVVRSIEKTRKHPSYPHDVGFTPYHKGHYQRILAEMTFRQTMQVWEDAIQFRIDLGVKVNYAARQDPKSPFRGRGAAESARAFFGIDEHGNRNS